MYEIIEGDLEPDLYLTILVNDEPEDISGSTVEMRWKKPDGTVETVSLTAVNLALGQVKRVWLEGDTDIVGWHKAQIIVTRPGGEVQTFPSDGSHFVWRVSEQLD
jgi:hypothetical protein